MADAHALDALIQGLRRLPGVGVKSASRMAYHMLQHDREGAQMLAQALQQAANSVQHCERCHTFTEATVCSTCLDPERDATRLCVVETPADQSAVERTSAYRGLYFVLMGTLSPLDGLGPKDIGVQKLLERAGDGSVQEVILATNPTVEGAATAWYIAEQLRQPSLVERGLRITRIAHGVPMGGELEYIDGSTLAHSLSGRQLLHKS